MSGWDKWEPWMEDGFVDYLLQNVSTLDFLDYLKIPYNKIFSSSYSAKLQCPIPQHLDGNERTPSMFVFEEDDRIKCFGCGFSGSLVDLYMAMKPMAFDQALKDLYFAFLEGQDIQLEKKPPKDPLHRMAPWVFAAGVAIREFVERQADQVEWRAWADKRFRHLDKFLDMPDEDWKKAKRYLARIKKYMRGKNGN